MVRVEAVDDDWNIIRNLSFRLLPPLAGRSSFESDFNLFLKGFFYAMDILKIKGTASYTPMQHGSHHSPGTYDCQNNELIS